MIEYTNNNYLVKIYKDGTKERIIDDNVTPDPIRPESLDIKITNQCSLENYCTWCHESSTIKGDHGNSLDVLKRILIDEDYTGTELAIGGGNPLQYPDLEDFLLYAKSLNLICNITVNEKHLNEKETKKLISLKEQELIWGVGVSYSGSNKNSIIELGNNVVLHMIAGINQIKDLDFAIENGLSVLVLGYKTFGRGEKHFSDDVSNTLWEWKSGLRSYLDKVHLSFDNLGIKQLKPERFLSKEYWDSHYMGHDGQFTMYVDCVKEQFARSSTSPYRWDISNRSLKDMFTFVRPGTVTLD